MLDIIDAFISKVAIQTACTVDLIGGWYTDELPVNELLPYGVLSDGSGGEMDYDTSVSYSQPVTITVALYARTLGDIRATIKAFRDAFNRQPLILATGRVISSRVTAERWSNEATPETDSVSRKSYEIEFEFLQQQEHP